MNTLIPEKIERCITDAANRFGRSLEQLNWPSGNKDAAPSEVNAIINLSFYLDRLDPSFDLYAEGTIDGNCRVDLMGSDGEIALVVEAKKFGHINNQSSSALGDLNRIKRFRPSLAHLKDQAQVVEWWDQAATRWGIILISSFKGTKVKDAWLSNNEAEIIQLMSTYKESERALDGADQPLGFFQLHGAFEPGQRRACKISTCERWDSSEGWMLWGAVPLLRPSVTG